MRKFLLLSLLIPLFSHAQEYFERISMEGVELVGSVKFGILDYVNIDQMETGLYTFPYDSRFLPKKDQPLFRCEPDGGMTYYDGRIYVMDYDDSGRVYEQKPRFRTIDAKTFTELSSFEQPDNCAATTTALAYDPTEDVIYGFLSTYTENFFVSVDPATGAVTRIAQLPWDNHYVGIACDKRGRLFSIYTNKATSEFFLAKVKKSDGRMANIGTIQAGNFLPDDAFVNWGYSQSLFFNNETDRLYWMYQSGSCNFSRGEYVPILEVDPATAEANMVAYFNESMMVSGAYFAEPKWTAPAVPTDFAYTPTGNKRMTGTVSMTLPQNSYIGEALTGNLSYVIKEGDKIVFEGTAAPGTRVTSEDITFTSGNHTVTLSVLNEANEASPLISRKFFAGYDVPAACKNIRLVQTEGLRTRLTWEPPTEGSNGATINPEGFTYDVVRYPGEIAVATGIKDCFFEEDHPADMTRYVYNVRANDPDAGHGKWAFSNNLIVGTPLEPPYGGYFRDPADLFNYYTILDNNKDGCTWSFDVNTFAAYYTFSPHNNADDYLISPPLTLKGGKEYKISFKAYSFSPDCLESLELLFGKGRDEDGQNKLLLYIDEVPAVSEDTPVKEYSKTVKVEEDGIYHYSLHCVSLAYSYYLYAFDIRIAELNPDGIEDAPVSPEAEVVRTEYYTPAGVRVENPRSGTVVIRRITLKDGSIKTDKVVR